MDFGLAALQQTITDSKNRGSGSDAKLGYISWKDGETKIVRFLTNEVISASIADRVITNDGKTKDFLIDESRGDFVAKYGGKSREYGTGTLIEPKITKKGVAVAVLRAEQADPTNPARRERSDLLIVVENQGQNYQGRSFGIIKQGIGNFWKPLMAVAARFDGLCDRDWAITRVGGDKDTTYLPSPIEPSNDAENALRDLAVVQQYYGYGRPWNPEDPARFLYCPETLVEWADYYGSEERAKFWLTPKGPAAGQQRRVFGFSSSFVQSYLVAKAKWGRLMSCGSRTNRQRVCHVRAALRISLVLLPRAPAPETAPTPQLRAAPLGAKNVTLNVGRSAGKCNCVSTLNLP